MDENYPDREAYLLIRALRHKPGAWMEKSWPAIEQKVAVSFQTDERLFTVYHFENPAADATVEISEYQLTDEELRELILELSAKERDALAAMTNELSSELDAFLEEIQS